MQKSNYLSSLLIALFFLSCGQQKEKPLQPKSGEWSMEMDLGNKNILPFEFELKREGDSWKMIIINDTEKIHVNEIEVKNDSFLVQLPVFESEFLLKLTSPETFSGEWINHYKGSDYKIPVEATFGSKSRFAVNDEKVSNVDGRYNAIFSPEDNGGSNAIGMFKQNGNVVTGTFATETGDYRHLAGNVSGDKLMLSTFDGSHAFLFTADVSDSLLQGKFFSGTHWEESWTAQKNDTFQLRNADSLTFIKEGYEGLAFSFPNANKEIVSLDDERYEDKAVIVQIMGSWCPNCLDETNYLSSLYDTYKEDGLEVIALAFERTKTEEKAYKNLERLKERTGADYEFLLGGATRDDKAAEKLPMLNHIMSYPTAIFIDKNKKVRRIHTGFYGPSTGIYYEEFIAETEALVEEMLSEK